MSAPKILNVIGDGLDMIGKLVKSDYVDDAARILDAIEAIWDAIDGVSNGSIKPEDARKELQRLYTEINANDAAADAAIDEKFDQG